MDSRRTAGALLWLLAVSSIVGTVIYLVLGMDMAVKPPDPTPTLDFAGRIEAFVPYLQARWPLELLAGVAFIVAFGTLVFGDRRAQGGLLPRPRRSRHTEVPAWARMAS